MDDVEVYNGPSLATFVVSADSDGTGKLLQRIKLAYSADGVATHVQADADGLLVNLGANNDVTIAGTVPVSLANIISVSIDDQAGLVGVNDGGGSLTVDGTVGITGSVAVTGTFWQATQPISGTVTANAGTGTFTVAGAVTNTVLSVVGGGTEATAQRVTIATDSTGVLSVDDNGGSLTVDGTVAVSGAVAVTDNSGSLTIDAPVGTPAFVRLSDGAAAITTLPVSLASVPSHAVTNAGTFAVQDSQAVTDNAGFTDGTTKVFAAGFVFDEVAGTALTENDAAAARIDSKRAQVGVIEDATTRGQRAAVSAAGRLSVDASGVAVPVTDNSGSLTVDNAGTFAVQAAQSGTWNITNVSGTISLPTGAATAAKQPALGTAGTPSADVITVQGVTSMTALKVDGSAVTQPVSGTVTANLAAGTNAIGKLAANSGVDIGDVDVTSLVPGTAATSLGKAVDSVAGATDTGVAILAIRDDALTTLTPVDGDYTPLRVSSTGALHVTGAGGGTQYNEDAAHTSGDTGTMALAVRKDTATALAGTDGDYTPLITNASGALHVAVASGSVTASGTIDVDGTVAHDAADSGDPVKVGFKAVNALPTAVATGDRANGLSDLFGRMLVAGLDPAMQVSKAINVTTTQTGTDVWTPASGKRIAVTDITISAYGTTAGRVILWFGDNTDTTYTAGTDQVLEAASFAPSATVKAGLAKVYGALNPVFCTTADRELHLTTDAAMSLDITVRGYEW